MSGLTQLVNWTSVTDSTNLDRLTSTNNLLFGEDGTVTATDYPSSQKCYIRPYSQSQLESVGLLTTAPDWKWTRELRFFVEWESEEPPLKIEHMTQVWSDGAMHCYKPIDTFLAFWLNPNQSITFHRFGVFDTATWDLLLSAYRAGALQRPWFNHATMPDPRS